VIILLRPKRQQAHEVQAVSVSWVDRQRLLAGDLSVEMPSGSQMLKAGLVERGRRRCRRRALIHLRAFAGGSAFPAVHQPVSA
jgi:hypothetical protein